MRNHAFVFTVLLAGCTEYTFIPDGDGVIGGTLCEDGLPSDAINVPVNDACDIPFQEGSFTPVVEWELTGYNGYGPPVVAQLDDDNADGVISGADIPDIVYCSLSGVLVVVDGASGTVKWTSNLAADGGSGLAVGDLEGDGVPEIIAANGPNQVVALTAAGTLRWTASIDSNGLYSFMYPSIADLDGDGLAEVIAGRTILDHNGYTLGTGTLGVGGNPNQGGWFVEGSIAFGVDLDMDGTLEVLAGNAAYNRNGTLKYSSGMGDGNAAVADFDGDGEPEVVLTGGFSVWTLESDLSPTGWSDTFTGTNYVGPPAIDDLDGDGVPDFVAVGANQMRAYRWDGSVMWTQPVTDFSGAAGPILFDFEMDGYPEVVYADEGAVRVFNGLDGSIKLESTNHSSATGFETPIVADVDNDGEVEIVMLHGWGTYGLTVYGDADNSWPAGRPVWNQHAYSITNVSDDATIPPHPRPNWTEYNSFRSGDAGLPPSAWHDVTPEVVSVCIDDCPDDLRIEVRVWNQGTEPVPPGLDIVVRAGVGGPVVTRVTVPDIIPSGRSTPGIVIDVSTDQLAGLQAVVEVDRDESLNQALSECDENNNRALIADVCQ